MKQNIYDNKAFSKEYDTMRIENKGISANDVIEIPIFRSMIPDVIGKTILDLGCGYGENDKYFKELGATYVLGTDISTHMIEIANRDNKTNGVEYKILPMEDIDSLDKKFDLVVSSLAFHYVSDFEKLVNDIYNLLNDGGYLVFSQEHPITSCLFFTEDIKKHKMELFGKKYTLVADYNRIGLRQNEWNGIKVDKYFRNFSYIINTLIKVGFVIDEINECEPTDEMIEKNPKFVNQYDSPYFLFVKAHKK